MIMTWRVRWYNGQDLLLSTVLNYLKAAGGN